MAHTSIPSRRRMLPAALALASLSGLAACVNGDCKKCIEQKEASGEYAASLNATDHYLPNGEARDMVQRFQGIREGIQVNGQGGLFPAYETFNLKTIDSILCQENTVGFRVYLAMDRNNRVRFVLTGAHADGKDALMRQPVRGRDGAESLEEITAENGQRWP